MRWTDEENDALNDGVTKYGEGSWALIQHDPLLGRILHRRNNIQLKDRWRNIIAARQRADPSEAPPPKRAKSESPKLQPMDAPGPTPLPEETMLNQSEDQRTARENREYWRKLSAPAAPKRREAKKHATFPGFKDFDHWIRTRNPTVAANRNQLKFMAAAAAQGRWVPIMQLEYDTFQNVIAELLSANSDALTEAGKEQLRNVEFDTPAEGNCEPGTHCVAWTRTPIDPFWVMRQRDLKHAWLRHSECGDTRFAPCETCGTYPPRCPNDIRWRGPGYQMGCEVKHEPLERTPFMQHALLD